MVMRKLRTKMTIFLWFAIAIFVGFIFLEWGMKFTTTKKLTSLERGIIGEVNGRPLSYTAYSNLIGQYKEQGIEQYKCGELAFEVLVESALLNEVFERRRFKLTDEEVVKIIENNPPPELLEDTLFQTDGKFDYNKYHSIITNPANLGWLMSYEAMIRSRLPRQLLYQEIVGTVRPTTIDLFEGYAREKLLLKLEYALVDKNKLETPKDKVREYYANHREEFRIPKRPIINYVSFQVSPTLEDEAWVKNEADEIFERANSGVSLDSLATGYTCKLLTAETPVDGVRGPIRKEDGYHILEGDKDLLLPIRPSDETLARAEERAINFIESAKSGFDETATAYGLKVEKSYGKIGEINLSYSNLKKPDKFIGPIEGRDCFYVLKTLGIEPSRVQDFSEVEDEARDKYLRREAIAFAEGLLKEAVGGDFRKVLSREGFELKTTGLFGLKDSVESPDFFIQASNIPVNKTGIAVTDKGVYLINCLERVEPQEEQIKKEIPEFHARWINEEGSRIYAEWFNNLKSNAVIKDYRYKIH